MKRKKKVLLISGGLLTLIIVISTVFIVNKNNSNNEIVMQDNDKNLINNSFLTLMLEQSDGSYQESTTNTWPSGNYVFNENLSRCENGGELEWDRENGIVNLLSNKSDACYVYFDLYNVVTITNVSATKTTNSVTLTVTVDAGENPVDKYYFSMDGGRSYQESTSPNYTFSELTPNTSYNFQVYAKDTLGYESNEEVIEVTTDNYVNPTVNSVTATNASNNSITVRVSASAGTNNIQTYYYSINNGSYTSSNSNTYTFSGLSAGTNYSIKVYVKDSNGVDSNVYVINAETENYIAPTVHSISITNTSSNSITVRVNASGGSNNISRYYYSVNNGSYISSSSNSYTFNNLSSNTTYSIKVYVTDSNNIVSNTSSTSATTISKNITFTITLRDFDITASFEAEEGMTWKEFIESDYNNNSANQFEISSNNYVVINIEAFPFPFTLVNGTTPITSNSEITNNTIYEAIFD